MLKQVRSIFWYYCNFRVGTTIFLSFLFEFDIFFLSKRIYLESFPSQIIFKMAYGQSLFSFISILVHLNFLPIQSIYSVLIPSRSEVDYVKSKLYRPANDRNLSQNFKHESQVINKDGKSTMWRAQCGQDRFIDHVLGRYLDKYIKESNPNYKPLVLEAGAADGEFLSNSYYFERLRGFTCILVEPNEDLYNDYLIDSVKGRDCFSLKGALNIGKVNDIGVENYNKENPPESEYIPKFAQFTGAQRPDGESTDGQELFKTGLDITLSLIIGNKHNIPKY